MLNDVHRSPGSAAQQGVQACSQFAQVEGFEQVVVAAGLQAIDAVGDGIAGGEDQHRQRLALLPQALQQLETIFVGQPQVEHHDVERRGLEHGLGRAGTGHPVDGHALGGQAGTDAAGDQVIILAEQYVHGGVSVSKGLIQAQAD
ncbi:hypothetical protein D3C79_564880 [compost metagenome]